MLEADISKRLAGRAGGLRARVKWAGTAVEASPKGSALPTVLGQSI